MKPLAFSVLRALAPGDFCSGETLARTLGMSRGSVWHAVRELEAAGVQVYKVRGRGYRLPQPLSLLDRAGVLRELADDHSFFSVEIVPCASSTNTLLLQQAVNGSASGTVVAAEWQTAGRGRFGRVWHAGIGEALTFSLLWRFEQGASALAGLSLAAGMAVVRALRGLGIASAGVKWPNDVLWKGRKLAGILVEMQGDALGPSVAVIGIGLNVRMSRALQERIDQPAADLETAMEHMVDRNCLLARLLMALREVLMEFARTGFRPLQREWQSYHVLEDAAVRLTLPDGATVTGVAQGVSEEGALLLATRSGVKRFYSGEVSLRPAVGTEWGGSSLPRRSSL
jgi:BirA family transcriptional regulator, biotin operon repressor / biotin---[acetyl-CoA-carboxylase] ligase